MQFVIENMLIPGKVESWVNLVEMNKQGLTELPLKSLMKLSGVLQDVYKCRLAHSFIINPPSSIYFIWKCFSPFIDKVTQSKIIIVKEGVSEQMMELYYPSQLEKRFGGISDNLEQFWPPVFPDVEGKNQVETRIKKKKVTVVKSLEESEIEDQQNDSVLSEAKSRHSEQEGLFQEISRELVEIQEGGIEVIEEVQFDADEKEIVVFAEPLEIDHEEQEEKEKKRRRKERKRKRKEKDALKVSENGDQDGKITDIKASDEGNDLVRNKEIVETNIMAEVHEKIPNCGCDLNKCDIF
jgi:hypothetical protein